MDETVVIKPVGKNFEEFTAQSMVKSLPFQLTKQDMRFSERRKQCQTHACLHRQKMP